MLNTDIDNEIEKARQELERLKEQKALQQKKMEGVDKFRQQMDEICNEYGLSREELILGLGSDLVEWVKTLNRLPERPESFNELKSYFARIIGREGTGRKGGASSAAASTGPKLEVGTYRNPHTGESIEKIKRNPKTLENWLREHGIETVRSWKV